MAKNRHPNHWAIQTVIVGCICWKLEPAQATRHQCLSHTGGLGKFGL